MADCATCGKHTSMPFTCKFCEQSFCGKHRLPENHDCSGLEAYKEKSHEDGKVGYDIPKKDTASTDITPETADSSASVTDRVSLPAIETVMPFNATYTILGIMIGVFMLEVTVRGFADAFSLTPGLVLQRPWTLVTSMFLHGGLTHLLVNSIVLVSFGTTLEKMLGVRKYLKILFAAGIASSIGFTISGYLVEMGSAVGISGALFGLVGLLAVLRPDVRVLAFFIIPLKIRTAVAVFGAIDLLNLITQVLAATGLYAGPSLYNAVLGMEVASIGHLSGLAIGLFYGYKLKDQYRPPQQIVPPSFQRSMMR